MLVLISLIGAVWPLTGQGLLAGEWEAYLSHRNSVATEVRDGIVYTATGGGLYRYDPEFDELKVFSTVDGLSGISPSALHHAPATGQLFLGYSDGQIDVLERDGSFSYLSEINRNTFYTQKGILTLASDQERLFVGAEFGLVIYGLDNLLPETDITQFADNPTRVSVISVALFADRIWVLLENDGLYSAPVDFPNLKDPGIWREERGRAGLPLSLSARQMAGNSSDLYLLADTTIWQYDGLSWAQLEAPWRDRWSRIYVTEEAFGASRLSRVQVKHRDGPLYNVFMNTVIKDVTIIGPNRFFAASEFEGGFDFNAWEIRNMTPAGPASNDCVRVAAGNGELYIAPRGYDQAYTPQPSAQGIFYFRPDTGWAVLDSASGELPKAISTGFARAFYDKNSEQAYLGSWGAGLLTLRRGQVVDAANCQQGLSVIAPPCNPNAIQNTRVSGMDIDLNGYLWVTLDFAIDPLMVRTPEGAWLPANSSRIPGDDHFIDMVVDDYGSKWVLNTEQGVFVYNDRGTPEDMSDDFSLTLRSGINQGNLPTNDVYSIARDQDGFIWVGTSQGVTVFYDTWTISQGQIVDAAPPVYQQFPLLKDAIIRAIEVDGGNRKWLATDDGVYLVSPDGDDILLQFDVNNSPLLANTVNDIAVDHATGQVYFATASGLIGYQGDATDPSSTCNDLQVFPNPVTPDYDGLITIRGMGAESRVKITTVSGLLVNEVDAQGGTAVWDGRDVYGNLVRSGVYLAMSTDRNGDQGCIGKFVVIGSGNP